MLVIILFRSEAPRLKRLKSGWANWAKPVAFPVCMTAGTLYLVFSNAAMFFNPKPVNSLSELGQQFLQNRADESVLLLMGFFLVVVLMTIIIRTPIGNWQQVKVLGVFEATKIRAEAEEELKYNRELDFNRMIRVQAITSVDEGYQSVKDRITGPNQIDVVSLLDTVSEAIAKSYSDGNVSLDVQYGVVKLTQPLSGTCPEMVRELIHLLRDHKTLTNFNGWESVIVCPITLGQAHDYVIWLRSGEYQFSEVDVSYMESMRNVTEHYAALGLYQFDAGVI